MANGPAVRYLPMGVFGDQLGTRKEKRGGLQFGAGLKDLEPEDEPGKEKSMPRKQQQCSICNSEDHNARGCPKKTGGAEHKVAKFRPPGAASISKNIVGAEALEQIAAEMEADAAALRRVAARLRAK